MRSISHHKYLMIFLPFCFFLLPVHQNFAQEYNYINYDVKDGLAGSTVYAMCQDKNGFMWFATEAGVSRFDGTHFKNFSTADGLPETEILGLYADSEGRVWMAPFKSTLCYYYNGKIYNQENDSLLKKIKIRNVIYAFAEEHESQTIIMVTGANIFFLKPATSMVTSIPFESNAGMVSLGPNPVGKGLVLATNDSIYTIVNEQKYPWLVAKRPPGHFVSEIFANGSISYIKHPPTPTLMEATVSANKTIRVSFINSTNGSWMVDPVHADRYREVFLKGKNISRTVIDNENNLWFSTLGQGVYKLASREFRTFNFPGNKSSEIFSIEKFNDRLLAGSGFYLCNEIRGTKARTLNVEDYVPKIVNILTMSRVLCIKKIDNDVVMLGLDGLLLRLEGNPARASYIRHAIKSIDIIDRENILVGTSSVAAIVDAKTLDWKKVLYKNRSTAVASYNQEYYIGTVDGLYVVNQNGDTKYLGDSIPTLRSRISYFAKSPDGRIFIATYGSGIICMKDDKVVNHISTQQGLTSNICRTLFLDNNHLWVGTDKGLNKINIYNATGPVVNYTTADGLPSNIINAIYIDSGKIYVGSPAGLTFFDENRISNHSRCDLKILDLTFSNQSRPASNHYELKHTENSLKIAFVGISFKSGGDILYRYRLNGLSDNWDSTRQTTLEYPSLPPGSYELQLEAINKFGRVSNQENVLFTIYAPYWQTLWFKIGLVVLVICITWLLVANRYRIIRRREQEKAALQQKLNDLEQMALRAQMNPHFIFNCLNSIQNFIIANNLEATNQYLTEFAYLIRQTLDNSDKGAISVANEIKYLSRYLEMEKMRFGNSFNYTIETDPQIDTDSIKIPTMILQPYVENCIRHGVRNKKEGMGLVEIKFLQNRNGLVCIVQDNGIGREKAHELKSHRHVEYQSKGMSLTADRINILNRQHAQQITIEVTDLKDATQQALGTRVAIHIPGNILTKIR
jgi:ligand-binding sensor domain-containing protein